MKILHLFNEIKFSGAEIMYTQAAPLFQKEGYEMLAFSTGPLLGDYAPMFEKNGITVFHKPITFKELSFKGIQYYFNFYLFLKKEKIDVLHIHRSNLIIAAVVAKIANVKCVKTQHSYFVNRWFTLPYAIVWRFMLRIFCKVTFQTISQSVYLNELNYYKNPSVKVHNWFDEKRFYPALNQAEKAQLRHQLNIPLESFVIISVGGCSHNKNHHDIIKAIALVKRKINVLYLHLGRGASEIEEKKLALDLGILNQIRFLGNQDAVRSYLVAADLFVMTSKFEGLSTAALEAMACKLPCILYNVSGLRDLINNNDNGFLISPDYRLLAKKMLEVQRNPSDALGKANNAFSFVSGEFSRLVNVKKIIGIYNNKK